MKDSIVVDLYFPCIIWQGKSIIYKVSQIPMTRLQCEQFLKSHYSVFWNRGEAIPQYYKHYPLI